MSLIGRMLYGVLSAFFILPMLPAVDFERTSRPISRGTPATTVRQILHAERRARVCAASPANRPRSIASLAVIRDLAIVFVAAGATIFVAAGGIWLRDLARRRPCANVLDMIEARPPTTGTGVKPSAFMPLRCACGARLMQDRERNIAEAVRTGVPCRPVLTIDGIICATCGAGPCRGVDRNSFRASEADNA